MEARHDLDWLRVFAVLLLLPFHSARVFDPFEAFYVHSVATSEPLFWSVIAFISLWQMQLLFVLAGAASWFAFGRRNAHEYRAERVKRLLVPLLFGLVVIVPIQSYLVGQRGGLSDLPAPPERDHRGGLRGADRLDGRGADGVRRRRLGVARRLRRCLRVARATVERLAVRLRDEAAAGEGPAHRPRTRVPLVARRYGSTRDRAGGRIWRSADGRPRRSSSTRGSRPTTRRRTGRRTRRRTRPRCAPRWRRSSPSSPPSSVTGSSSGPTEMSGSAPTSRRTRRPPARCSTKGYVQLQRRRPRGRVRDVGDGVRSARALPRGGGRRWRGRGSRRNARPLGKAGHEITSRGQLKTAPRGYPKDHPRIELLRYKGIARVALVGRGRMARYGEGQGPRRVVPP